MAQEAVSWQERRDDLEFFSLETMGTGDTACAPNTWGARALPWTALTAGKQSLLGTELMLKPAAPRQDAVLGGSELPVPGGVQEDGDVLAETLQKIPRPWFWPRREPGDLGELLPALGARGLVENRRGGAHEGR